MKNGPELWTEVLKQFPPGAVIAGGAVRDYLLGFEPKDIDVFIGADVATKQAPPTQDKFFMEMFDVRFGLFRIDVIYERIEEYAALNNIDVVSSGTILDHKVDAILLMDSPTPLDLVKTFDFGINWCWFDGEIHQLPKSEADMESRCVTLMHFDRPERSALRFERFNERHGNDWIYV